MAHGGGTFLTQNKVLPGTYINFVSAARASVTLSDRGIAALPLELDWGVDDAVFTVTSEEFQKNSMKHFGYPYDHEKLKGLRDLFRNIHTGHFYKLMNNGVAAENIYCIAKYKGIRGNDIKIVVATNIDDESKVDVSTYVGTRLVDKQTVLPNTNNLIDNDWVVWKKNVDMNPTAGLPLTSGSNGDVITGLQYQDFLDAIESYSFNTLGCLSVTEVIINLVVQFTKRMRDEVGIKFQTVVYKTPADYEGVISVENKVLDEGVPESSLVYWVTGAEAGCPVNRSLTNTLYDGEFNVDTDYTQSELKDAILSGKFILHKVGDNVRVLEDINTFITVTDEKSSDFSSNQTIRVLDQIGNDIAALFNSKYLGNVPNDESGRISLWNDIVTHHQQLQSIRAIEDFEPEQVTVEKGNSKKAVVVNDVVTPVNAMSQLYMTVVVQ